MHVPLLSLRELDDVIKATQFGDFACSQDIIPHFF